MLTIPLPKTIKTARKKVFKSIDELLTHSEIKGPWFWSGRELYRYKLTFYRHVFPKQDNKLKMQTLPTQRAATRKQTNQQNFCHSHRTRNTKLKKQCNKILMRSEKHKNPNMQPAFLSRHVPNAEAKTINRASENRVEFSMVFHKGTRIRIAILKLLVSGPFYF